MFYQLKPTFEAVQEKPAEGVPWVEVITQQEMGQPGDPAPLFGPQPAPMATAARQSCSTTVPPAPCWCPGKNTRCGLGHSFAFLLTVDHLTFVDDTGPDRGTVGTAFLPARTGGCPRGAAVGIPGAPHPGGRGVPPAPGDPAGQAGGAALGAGRKPQRFENQLHRCRRTLLKLSAYYAPAGRAGRHSGGQPQRAVLQKTVPGLRAVLPSGGAAPQPDRPPCGEYSLQLHQIYQSKIDLKQNRVMQFLTVVTTVFMPPQPSSPGGTA